MAVMIGTTSWFNDILVALGLQNGYRFWVRAPGPKYWDLGLVFPELANAGALAQSYQFPEPVLEDQAVLEGFLLSGDAEEWEVKVVPESLFFCKSNLSC